MRFIYLLRGMWPICALLTAVAPHAQAGIGACGFANGVAVSSPPTAGLCNAGTASVVSGPGPWSWTCTGGIDGTVAQCGALRASTSIYTYDLVKDFGAAPDSTLATDAALRAFSKEAQRRTRPAEGTYRGFPGYYPGAGRNNLIVLTIPAGKFTYSWNRFTMDIPRLEIVGAGSGRAGGPSTILQNVNRDGNWFDMIAVRGNWDFFGDGFYASDNFGWHVRSVAAGARTVRLIDADLRRTAKQFAVGRWVLVMSYSQQQYGYPPDMRYYDFARVVAIDPKTQTITLDTPLHFAHRADRPYGGPRLTEQNRDNASFGEVGPAAIVPIDTPQKPIQEYARFSGIHVLGNPCWTACGMTSRQQNGDIWQLSGIVDGAMDDIWLDNALGATQLRNFTIANSRWRYDESDKIINNLTYKNDVVGTSLVHAGQLMWQVIGGTLGHCSVSAMNALFKDAVIDGVARKENWLAGIQLDVGNYTNAVVVYGNTFIGADNKTNYPIAGPQAGAHSIEIDGKTVDLPDGPGTSLIRIKKELGKYGTPSEKVVDNWADDAAVMKNRRFIPGARVQSITGDADYVYVAVAGMGFRNGDLIYAARLQNLTATENVGRNTGFDWSDIFIIHKRNIPSMAWSGNRGN